MCSTFVCSLYSFPSIDAHEYTAGYESNYESSCLAAYYITVMLHAILSHACLS